MESFWGVILTSTVVTTLINIGWKVYDGRRTFKNARYMQISNYYRESSGKEMHRILERWTEMLFKIEDSKVKNRMNNVDKLNQLINDTYLYSSPETCRRVAKYQQYAYTKLDTKEHQPLATIILVSGVITSLKHDFTGDWISIEETLRIKLNDYVHNEKKIKAMVKKFGYEKEGRATTSYF